MRVFYQMNFKVNLVVFYQLEVKPKQHIRSTRSPIMGHRVVHQRPADSGTLRGAWEVLHIHCGRWQR